jgi:hypothetical protein
MIVGHYGSSIINSEFFIRNCLPAKAAKHSDPVGTKKWKNKGQLTFWRGRGAPTLLKGG